MIMALIKFECCYILLNGMVKVFLYFSNAYMVYLMIVQRSRNAERVMVFDVKQFKSLEGFLESGPQFVLQAYILLRNPLEEGRSLLYAVLIHCIFMYIS